MGIKATKLDTSRYFPDPKIAAFVADIQDGNLKRVAEALKGGMNPNVAGNEGIRPLFFIFSASTADVTRALLAAGADPNTRLSGGNTPLYYAVRMENTEFTKALLEWKADPNARVEHNEPIIHEAVLGGQPDQIKLLARAGADINAVWSGTPLYASIGAMDWGVAATLLDLGADVHWRSPGGLTQYTAAERFCNQLTRSNNPLKATPTNHQAVLELFAAFARRGVVLPCTSEAARFR